MNAPSILVWNIQNRLGTNCGLINPKPPQQGRRCFTGDFPGREITADVDKHGVSAISQCRSHEDENAANRCDPNRTRQREIRRRQTQSYVSVWIICDGLETDILQPRFQCSSCHLADPLVYFSQLIQPPFVVLQMWQYPKKIILIISKTFKL